jgi:hypothetical protein
VSSKGTTTGVEMRTSSASIPSPNRTWGQSTPNRLTHDSIRDSILDPTNYGSEARASMRRRSLTHELQPEQSFYFLTEDLKLAA